MPVSTPATPATQPPNHPERAPSLISTDETLETTLKGGNHTGLSSTYQTKTPHHGTDVFLIHLSWDTRKKYTWRHVCQDEHALHHHTEWICMKDNSVLWRMYKNCRVMTWGSLLDEKAKGSPGTLIYQPWWWGTVWRFCPSQNIHYEGDTEFHI